MKRLAVMLMAFTLIAGCAKKTETEQTAQQPATETAQKPQTTDQTKPSAPPMRPSDAKISVDSPTLAAGSKGSFGIHYHGVEPAKALVMPFKIPEGMTVDSVSFAGSMVDYLANKPVRIDNPQRLLLIGAVPVTEPKIPAEDGLLATVHFTLSADAKSGKIEESFAPPANYMSYVDTTNALVQPYFEAGTLTVQ